MEKIYIGKGKVITTKYDPICKINIDINGIPDEYKKTVTRKDGTTAIYTNLDIVKLKNADDKGNTHSVLVNTYKPGKSDQSEKTGQTSENIGQTADDINEQIDAASGDVPF